MCHFISWIRHADGYYFLTDDDMKTEKGKKLKEYLSPLYWTDIIGHGAIVEYFRFDRYEGIHDECTSLANPIRLPLPITEAVKAGKFRLVGKPEKVSDLLTKEVAFLYEGEVKEILREELLKENIAYDKSEEVRNKAWREYEKVTGYSTEIYQTLYADYELAKVSGKVDIDLLADMEKTLSKVYKHYIDIREKAEVDRLKTTQVGFTKYNTTHAELENESKQKIVNLFWDTFADINNRQPLWR